MKRLVSAMVLYTNHSIILVLLVSHFQTIDFVKFLNQKLQNPFVLTSKVRNFFVRMLAVTR